MFNNISVFISKSMPKIFFQKYAPRHWRQIYRHGPQWVSYLCPPGNPKLEEDDDTAPGVPNELRCFETFSSDSSHGILKESLLVRDGISVNDKSVSKHFFTRFIVPSNYISSQSAVTINMQWATFWVKVSINKYNSTTRNSFRNYGIWRRD